MFTAMGYLVLLAVFCGVAYCYKRPAFSFVLVTVLYPLKQLQMSYMPIFAAHSAWFNYIICAGVVMGVIGNLTRNRGAITGYGNKVFIITMILYAFSVLSILWSPSGEYAVNRTLDGAPYWAMQIALMPLVFLDLGDFRRIQTALLLTASVVIVLFFTNPRASFYTGRLTLEIGYFHGEANYRGNPLATAQVGGQLAILAALMLPIRQALFVNILRIAAVFLGLGIALAAGSRGQLILAIFVMVAFYPLARKVKNVKQFFINMIGLGIFGAITLVAFRYFLSQDQEQSGRWDLAHQWEVVAQRSRTAWSLIEAWVASPLHWPFGLGNNAFSYISGEQVSYAHNIIIEMIGEYGLFGITMWSIMAFWMIRECRALYRLYADDPAGRATAASFMALAAYLGLLAMKQGTWVGSPDCYFVPIILCKLMYRERTLTQAWDADSTLAHQSGDAAYEPATE